MAEKIIQFHAKKEIFDWAAARLACLDCKVVPKVAPIFQTSQGDVLCSICKTKRSSNSSNYSARSFLCSIWKPKSKLTAIFRNFVLEDLLMSLPTSCKFQKNECPVVQDRELLKYHEKTCEFRDVLCLHQNCKGIIPANQFKKHFLEYHQLNLNFITEMEKIKMSESGLYKFKQKMETKHFYSDFCGLTELSNESNSFLIHCKLVRGLISFGFSWLVVNMRPEISNIH